MSKNLEVQKIKKVVKQLLKKKKKTYQDLAQYLDLSLPTVKRILNQDDLSFERLAKILEWLELSFFQAAELAEQMEGGGRISMTYEQDSFFANHLGHYRIFFELRDHLSPKEIQEKFNLTDHSLEKYLLDLDKIGVIELHANRQVKMVRHKTTHMLPDGDLLQTLNTMMVDTIADEAKRLPQDNYPDFTCQLMTRMLMSKETFEKLREDLQELADRYDVISGNEKAFNDHDDLIPVYFLGVSGWTMDVKNKVLGVPKNFN